MRARRQLGPSYEEESYWDAKFQHAEVAYEWLGSGEILLEAFSQAHPRTTTTTNTTSDLLPRVLHLGAGTSKLSLLLAQEYRTRSHSLDAIINVDFSQAALVIGKEQAELEGVGGMQYLRVDLRSWTDLSSAFDRSGDHQLDFILDKSTSDAISTNADVAYDGEEEQCPLLAKSGEPTRLDPLDVVALHLAALSRPGCQWAILSYSSSRLDFLSQPGCQSRRYWTLRRQTSVEAPSGSGNLHAPQVYHHFYLLQRNPHGEAGSQTLEH